MRIAKKTHYGLKILAHLARDPQEWYSLARLSRELNLPLSFLKHIAAALKHAKILESQGGMHGGYRLIKPLASITLADVFDALDEKLNLVPCPKNCSHANCLTGAFWEIVAKRLSDAFTQSSLETVVKSQPQKV